MMSGTVLTPVFRIISITKVLFDSWAAVINLVEKGLDVAKVSTTFFTSSSKDCDDFADLTNRSGLAAE